MADRIETIKAIHISNGKSIQTEKIIDLPTNEDIANLLTMLGTSHFARIEIVRPVVEICDAVGSVVDYEQSSMTTIIIKLKGE